MKNISFSSPDIINEDIQAVIEVIKSGWLIHGKYSKTLEELFCEFTGANYAATVSNCTAGLHLSCLSAGFGKGDEVIIPAQTHTATAHAIEYTGAKPIFADVDTISGNICVDDLESKLTEKTKGIIPVHMAGYPCDMERIKKISINNNLILIEDCAHSIGTTFDNKHVGTFGQAGCFSFYPTKQITTGEGGIVITNEKIFIEKINKLKAFGIDAPPKQRSMPGLYDVKELGYNYRMTDFQAALGVGQMKRYSTNLQIRKKNAKLYCDLLKNEDKILLNNFHDDCSYFLYQIVLSHDVNRDQVLLYLKENGIGVSIHYANPVPLMSYYKNKYGYSKGNFINAEYYSNKNISLPVHAKLSNEDIKYICRVISAALRL
ncbi:MAG: cell wall biogenesis protein [Candidatus Marinimicrobia bacterium]|nr:cell wall biogenesis protein [Candidatus Neomarinimicrobiota bacterium]|tara:strand:+ start:1097 stop:2221 length:1125 start_codon:yes stop_codon:yes gene_type:complete